MSGDRKERMLERRASGETYKMIGDREGLTKQRVAQILKPSPPIIPTLLTIGAAARLIGVHRNTLRRWTREGKVDCARLPNSRRDRRFSRQELDRFLQQGGDAMKR